MLLRAMFIVILFFQISAFASVPMCRDLFAEQKNISPAQVLKSDKLSKYNFKLNDQNQLIDLTDNSIVGTLDVIKPTHLYEWAPLDYHQTWVHNGSISKSDMLEILKEPGQSMGRGYYVSTNPFDSSEYGDGLTIFKTNGPVVKLAPEASGWSRCDKPQYLNRLQAAGIDALISKYHSMTTWLSIISVRHLKIATTTIDDHDWNDVDFNLLLKHADKLKKSDQYGLFKKLILSPTKNLKKHAAQLIENFQNFTAFDYDKIATEIRSIDNSNNTKFTNEFIEKTKKIINKMSAEQAQQQYSDAFLFKEFEILPTLLRRGDYIDQIIPRTDQTALMIAIENSGQNRSEEKTTDLVKIVLEMKPNLNIQTHKNKSTALMLAAYYTNLSVTKLLVEAGCDINIVNNLGYTALHYAKSQADQSVYRYLLSVGAK
jgi:Ankyrin repeats (3 copies)